MWGETVSLGATVRLPLFASTHEDPMIAARATTVGSVAAQREAALRQLKASLTADLAKHRALEDKLDRSRQTFVPLAQSQSDLATASYGAGRGSLTDTLQALVALADTRVDALDREADVVRDAVRINITYEAAQP